MSTAETRTEIVSEASESAPTVADRIKRFYRGRDHLRRGICLLNAGCYHEAAGQFNEATRLNPESMTLPHYLAHCHYRRGAYAAAAEQMVNLIEQDPDDTAARIRRALLIWKDGGVHGALQLLRDGVREAPDCAEMHFQLGALLASMGEDDEAELRFTQAITLDGRHTESLVSLAMCLAKRYEPADAVRYLRRAQILSPHDARIGLYLTIAMQAAEGRGLPVKVVAVMPMESEEEEDEQAINELSLIIEQDPDFVDAFIRLPQDDVDEGLYRLLLQTIRRALDRRPDLADLYFHCGQVLGRLGQSQEAIASMERALALKPQYVQALIQLAKLYKQTDRWADATERLEEALRLGAQYADVYCLLGNLHRDSGRVDRAREAYRHALTINGNYKEAQTALANL